MSTAECSSSFKSAAGRDAALTETEERWLYSMTRHSTHPLPVRIGQTIAREHFPEPVRSFVETPGCGMEGSVDGHVIWMGSAAWLESRGVRSAALTPLHGQNSDAGRPTWAVQLDSNRKRPQGRAPTASGSVVHVAIDGQYRGCFVLASALRPETERLLARLSGDFEIALLSGDNVKERGRFETLLGREALLRFNQSPLDKLNFIKQQQQTGRTVMMVGDGLNDAGALKQSDVGVAVVENIGAFSPASDVIVAAGMVPRLADVLRYAQRSVGVVRAAFLISAVYNALGVAIAASGRLSPVVCAILMPLSSVTVVAFACGAATWLGRRGLRDGQSSMANRQDSAQRRRRADVEIGDPMAAEAQP
jgi:Cu+-exporting ATPase